MSWQKNEIHTIVVEKCEILTKMYFTKRKGSREFALLNVFFFFLEEQ
jgi:hypothetical protein